MAIHTRDGYCPRRFGSRWSARHFRSRSSGFFSRWWGLISVILFLILLGLGVLDRITDAAKRSLAASARGGLERGFACGFKRYCGEMSGCAEARFYFTQCGLSRLDGDRDGVPCETLCRRW
jgi:excalibur calcium-binding domain-containing protein